MLLQADFNYRERGMATMLWTAALDARSQGKPIASRIGLEADAHRFDGQTHMWEVVMAAHHVQPLSCVLIDKAQFLSKEQVWQCARLVDEGGIPVLCYGLRTDFQGELFSGSAILLGIADALIELKAVCHCGRKAIMNLRVDDDGGAVKAGVQTEIGGNGRYVALCRRHFTEALNG
ncbi:thymidine kinase [Altererythrobacter indicus]|uniref:Thymidine kinase n=1 Tax=Altericroceibacterium indicum TaxID=374177 RepID=A0A845AAH5_9SPHN|nr:thymidine kinase [Altericroceibacterium indicum]